MEVGMYPVVEMPPRGWTFDDLQRIEDDDWRRYEVIDGALHVSPSATPLHEFVSEQVRAAIREAIDSHRTVIGPISVGLGRSHLIPDLAVVPNRIFARPGTKQLNPSDVVLLVEVVSPGSISMDRVLKPMKYAAAGIGAYWRVETDPVSLTAYVLREDSYVELGTWHPGDIAEVAEPFAVRIAVGDLVPPSMG